ncbi:MAG: hypothetical protein ACO3NZ_14895, partial [Pirellulales bacterium]
MTADSSKTRSTHLRGMPSGDRHPQPFRAGADWPFFVTSGVLGGGYVVLLLALLAADVASTSRADLAAALTKPEILFAVRMTLVSCTLAALLSLWVAVPLGYLLER